MPIHFRHLMLYEFRKGSSVTIATKNICAVYGENALSSRNCRKWFQRFRAENFCLEDEERSGRPPQTDEYKIRDLVEKSRSLTVQEMSNVLKIPKTTIHRCLKKMGMVSKLNVWVPHELTKRIRLERMTACVSLLACNKHEPFLNRLATGDEKWILYENPERKRSWTQRNQPPQRCAKSGLHPRKVLLCVWWDYKRILHFELLSSGDTINSDKYCTQLEKLRDALTEKRPGVVNRNNVIFHYENATPHVAKSVTKKMSEINWEILPHHPDSSDIAPSR